MPTVETDKNVIESKNTEQAAVTIKTKRIAKSKAKKAATEEPEVVEATATPVKKVRASKAKKSTVTAEEVSSAVEEVSAAPVKKARASKGKKSTTEEQVEEVSAAPVKKTKVKAIKDPNAPKKELNPIMKEMNRFRNDVISLVVGSKAPKLTIPPFKIALADARVEMKLGEKDKNTVEVVQHAISLFEKNTSKYV
jgi:hypothetical protein